MKSSEVFRSLHAKNQLLILANAWDAGSARLIEECGAAAIATSSALLAWVHGYADGNALPPAKLLVAVEEIARVVRVPLSVDSEAGYSAEPQKVASLVRELASRGAAGINLEDGVDGPELLCRKIEAVKGAADVFVNARVDVYLKKLVPAERALDEAVKRAELYRRAGADGIFVPRIIDREQIKVVVSAIDPLPLNVLASPGLPGGEELRALGVRRLSAGHLIGRAALSAARRLAVELMKNGESEPLFAAITDSANLNELLTARGEKVESQ
jgi:2-methylisocitrate lyase-like PEP mutase family enzyme